MRHIRNTHLNMKHRCSLCEKQFTEGATLRVHEENFHGPNGLLPDGRSRFCPYCPLRRSKFSDSESLKAHIAVCRVERSFACDRCELRFRWKHHLVQHQRSTHEGLKKFICDDCGLAFTTKCNLQQHLFKPPKKGRCEAAVQPH